MSRLKVLLGLVWVLLGIIFVAIALPMARGDIDPNSFYGFRTVKTLSDPRIWYEANRVHGNDLAVAGIAMALSALVLLTLRKWFSLMRMMIMNVLIVIVALALALAHSLWALAKM